MLGGAPMDKAGLWGPPRRVLVVEDDPPVAELARVALEVGGHEARAVSTADMALRVAHGFQADLILVDVDLRGSSMNGIELIKKLKADARTARVPIMVFSALAMRDDQVRRSCAAAGVVGFVAKPFDIPKLLEEIRRITVEL